METTLNLGGGSARAPQDYADRQMGTAISAEEAFAQREKPHLGFNFQVIGESMVTYVIGLRDGLTSLLPRCHQQTSLVSFA